MQIISEAKIRRNYLKLKLIRFCRFLLFFLPILMPFYNSNNITAGQVIYLQAIFSFAVVIFEVPTGYISDKFSRVKSIQIGALLAVLCYGFYPFVSSFWIFAFLQVINALATSLISGSDDALLYDSMLSLNESHDYNIQNSKVHALSSYAETLAGIVGGVIALYSFNYNLILQTIFFFIAFLISLSLIEPPIHRPIHKTSYFQDIKQTFKYIIFENYKLKWLLIFGSVISSLTFVGVWLFQEVLVFNDLNIAYYGIFWAAMNLSLGICIQFIPIIQKHLSTHKIYLFTISISCLSVFFIGVWGALWSLIFYLGLNLARAIKSIVINHQINKAISSNIRATVLSIESLLFRLVFSLSAPLVGLILDYKDIKFTYIFCSIIFFVALSLIYRKLIPHLNE